ncbi:O-antigen polysaccharide polymerase Wzy [Thomasclavelia sp.]|uniref:O-antigen polysaccharide polymerase Wzy n=1 Tax=Thomasclavelia sp. TaxID=3025757 RepID=UPI0025D713D9|nr:O-antigen polysaccharide polymerase Wzy [Thomasclavelia sp.]
MKKIFTIKKYDSIVILLLISSILMLWMFKNINMITFISIIQIILFTFSIIKSNMKIFSISYIFVILTIITHLGHFFIYTFNIDADVPYYFDTFNNLEITDILEPGIFISTIIGLIIIGMIIGNNIRFKYEFNNKMIPNDYFKIIGKVFIFIGIFFEIYVDYNLISSYLTGGYLATTQFVESGIINTFSNFFKYGIIFLMIAYRKEKKKLTILYVLYNLFLIIPMFSGNRFNSILFIIVGAYVYFIILKTKISYIKIIKLLIFSLLLLAFLNIIADYRQSNLSYSDVANNFIKYLTGNNIIFDAFGEFGVTFYSVYYSMLCIPLINPYGFGLTYITPIITVFPSVSGVFGLVDKYLLYTNNFPSYYRAGLGGSYIGELYFNFGWYSLIFSLFIGIIIVWIEKKFIISAKNNNWISVIKILPIFVILLMWIRGYFRDFVRVYVWNLVLIYMIISVVNKLLIKNNRI